MVSGSSVPLTDSGDALVAAKGRFMAETAENVVAGPGSGPASYRTAPNNIEAEQALLGAILVNNDAFYRVSDFLEPDHFYEPLHRQIYKVTADMIRAA